MTALTVMRNPVATTSVRVIHSIAMTRIQASTMLTITTLITGYRQALLAITTHMITADLMMTSDTMTTTGSATTAAGRAVQTWSTMTTPDATVHVQ